MRTKRVAGKRNPPSSMRRAPLRNARPSRSRNRTSNINHIPKISIKPITSRRSFVVHSPTLSGGISNPIEAKETWLDKVGSIGAVLFKTISAVAKFVSAQNSDVTEEVIVPTGQTQLILLSAEDLLFSSDLLEFESVNAGKDKTELIPSLPFRNGRIDSATIQLECTGIENARAGKILLLVEDLSAKDASDYRDANTKGGKWDKMNPTSFEVLAQSPGVTTSPVQRPIVINWRPKKGFPSSQLLGMGAHVQPSSLADPPAGGDPVLAIYVGYQDFASSGGKTVNAVDLYNGSEGVFTLSVEAKVRMEEHGKCYPRWIPPVIYEPLKSAAVMDQYGRFSHELPFAELLLHPAGFTRTLGCSVPSSPMEHINLGDG